MVWWRWAKGSGVGVGVGRPGLRGGRSGVIAKGSMSINVVVVGELVAFWGPKFGDRAPKDKLISVPLVYLEFSGFIRRGVVMGVRQVDMHLLISLVNFSQS
jgi:hypothetical protein